MLTEIQGFKAMYAFLKKIYEETNDINVAEVMADLSSDPAAMSDWADSVGQFNTTYLTPDQGFEAMIYFLKFYQSEFGMELNSLIDRIVKYKDLGVWSDWLECVAQVVNEDK